jgi:hypothetical protein
MARWRQAVELAMTAKRLEGSQALRGRETRRRAACSGRKYCSLTRRIPRSLPRDKHWASIIRQCNVASSGRWRMARWQHSKTDRDRGRNRRLRPKPRLGWCLWRARRPRSTAIRTSCGRRGCWHAMHARTHRPLGTNVSPTWCRVRYARFLPKRKSSRTRCDTIWSGATPSSSRRWRKFCVFIAKSRS